MDVGALLEKVPTPALLFFTIVGVTFVARKVISYIQLLLSLFVLPGTNVSLPTQNPRNVNTD
jgi:17beta-estradiol 17-dehydrogenase / very-long-chain 3-oxoacyl-CoA reductase